MKKNFKYFVMAAVALLAMSACNNEMDEQNAVNGGELQPVQFQMAMANTRTVTDAVSRVTSWKVGDAIGIYALPAGTSNVANAKATNAKYVLGSDNTWKAEAGSEIYPEEALDYYAYYPYQADITDPTAINISAKADQSTTNGDDYGASDVLAGQTKNVAAGQGNVTLTFKHMFAMVEAKIEGDKVTKQPTKVELKGVKLDAVLNIMAATPAAIVKTDATAKDVTMYYLAREGDASAQVKPFSFRAVVPAQEIAANTPLVAIYAPNADNKTYTMQHTVAVPYNAGVFRQLNVNIGSTKTSLTIPAGDLTISPWESSEAIGGEGGEVVPLVTSVTPPITTDIEFIDKGIFSNDKVTDANSLWFHRENSSPVTTAAIASEEGPAIALTHGASASDKGSWNNSCIGYHFYGKLERTTYKMTLTMKSNVTNGIVGITVSSSQDDKMFKMLNDKLADWSRNVTTYGSIGSTWVTKTFYLDFTNASTEGKSSNLASYTETSDEDVNKGINIMLYNYTAGASTIYIKDIFIEKHIPTE